MSTNPTVYVLTGSDGTTTFYLPPSEPFGDHRSATWTADVPLEPVTDRSGLRRDWLRSERRATVLTASRTDTPTVIGWRLRKPELSVVYPAVLAREQWADMDDLPEAALYDPIYSLAEVTTRDFPAAEWIDLGERTPPPDDGRTWIARLPYALEQYPELHHLFPGTLGDFRDALAKRLEALMFHGNRVVVHTYNGKFEVVVEVPYSPKRIEWEGRLLRSGRRSIRQGANTEQFVKRRLNIPAPRLIAGSNRAEAERTWDETMEYWVGVVIEMAQAHACGHCGGTGVAPYPGPGGGSRWPGMSCTARWRPAW